VRVGGKEIEQGCWLDWEALRASLIESISDLLPAASVVPVLDAAPVRPDQWRRARPGRPCVRRWS
jgi:hypothetical protein